MELFFAGTPWRFTGGFGHSGSGNSATASRYTGLFSLEPPGDSPGDSAIVEAATQRQPRDTRGFFRWNPLAIHLGIRPLGYHWKKAISRELSESGARAALTRRPGPGVGQVRIMDEFFQQGDLQRSRGMDVTRNLRPQFPANCL